MGPDRRVQVALTPNGRADDVHTRDDNLEEDVFVLPHETYMCVFAQKRTTTF